MKVGDLVVYNLEPVMPGDEKAEMIAVVVAERPYIAVYRACRNFRIYYPYYNDFLNAWEDEYRVISS